MAEWSKALALGASPKGRGFEPRRHHSFCQTHWFTNNFPLITSNVSDQTAGLVKRGASISQLYNKVLIINFHINNLITFIFIFKNDDENIWRCNIILRVWLINNYKFFNVSIIHYYGFVNFLVFSCIIFTLVCVCFSDPFKDNLVAFECCMLAKPASFHHFYFFFYFLFFLSLDDLSELLDEDEDELLLLPLFFFLSFFFSFFDGFSTFLVFWDSTMRIWSFS